MDSVKLTNPHDKFFREAFSRKDMALGFVKEYLPLEIRSQMDLRKFEIVKDSYVDKEFAQHFSDILYQTRIHGAQSFFYILFEHKSYIDPLVPFQILRNMVKIWEQYLKQNPRAKKLPIIFPFLIYHGQRTWKLNTRFSSLFEKIEGTARFIPDFQCELFDITQLRDGIIRGDSQVRALLLLLKHIADPGLLELLPTVFGLLQSSPKSGKNTEYVEPFIRYLMATVESAKHGDLKKRIEKSLTDGGTLMPSIAEKLMKDGFEKGIEKGIERGFERGIEKGIEQNQTHTVEKMILNEMSNADIRKITGVSSHKLEEIRKRLRKHG